MNFANIAKLLKPKNADESPVQTACLDGECEALKTELIKLFQAGSLRTPNPKQLASDLVITYYQLTSSEIPSNLIEKCRDAIIVKGAEALDDCTRAEWANDDLKTICASIAQIISGITGSEVDQLARVEPPKRNWREEVEVIEQQSAGDKKNDKPLISEKEEGLKRPPMPVPADVGKKRSSKDDDREKSVGSGQQLLNKGKE